jgi:hypothetical protein
MEQRLRPPLQQEHRLLLLNRMLKVLNRKWCSEDLVPRVNYHLHMKELLTASTTLTIGK